jgi:RNA polymerase primary sigma factor
MPPFLANKTHARDAPFDIYLREINETPLLSEQEEKVLALRIADGDAEARDHMVRANLRLVVSIARGYTVKGLELQDLVEEGNLGLLRAVEGFDPSMETRFSTYATFWIRQSIKRAIARSAKPLRIPVYMVGLLAAWRAATSKLHAELGRPPTQEEVAGRLNLPSTHFNMVRQAIRVYNSVAQSDRTDHERSFDELVLDGQAARPDSAMEQTDDLKHVLRQLETMDARQAAVLRMRFGLLEEPRTLQEIGDRLGLTRERVRQIESEALAQLREALGAN